MRAVLIGGSGATGRILVQDLLNSAEFTEVIVLLRRKTFEEQPKLQQIIVDFNKLQEFEQHIRGDVAISCLGTTAKDAGSKDAQWKVDHDLNLQFAALAKKNEIPCFVLLSAVNADAGSKIFYNRMKGSLEQHVKALDFGKLIIVQPGGLIRPNTDRLGEKIGINALKAFNRIGLFKTYEALPVARVAMAMLQAIRSCQDPVNIISVKDIKQLSKIAE
ncbi:NAD(P)H-binding protein [Sphingobacterium sp. HMA12]|uniref:NAD(P)H-binding protein n=1 Tax=Sphingobacterium sp. HMA12 TaxID=2050894 RepID=UPI000CE9D179|nr:NAD(P)H-binding protein [Sphingobacterium sp. HMA12]